MTDWTDRIRLRNLQILLSLDSTKNISHSAAALHMTQPGLSKWLKDLELDIGLPLFERHARGLRPTPHGALLIAHSRRIDAHLSAARDEMASLTELGGGLVRIATWGAATADTVPQAVLRLQSRLPQLRVRMVEMAIDQALVRLQDGDFDIVVGQARTEFQAPGIESTTLYAEPLVLVARAGHPLAGKKRLRAQDLAPFTWISWPRGTPTRDVLDAALAAGGFGSPASQVETNSLIAKITLLANSNYVGFATQRTAHSFSRMGVLAILPIQFPARMKVELYWRAEDAGRPAIAGMLAALNDAVADISDGDARPAPPQSRSPS